MPPLLSIVFIKITKIMELVPDNTMNNSRCVVYRRPYLLKHVRVKYLPPTKKKKNEKKKKSQHV